MNVDSRRILGTRIHATTYAVATAQVLDWALQGASRYVCLATVSSVIAARDSTHYAHVMEQADLATSDGMPLVWALRALGIPSATRVYGPDLMPLILEAAALRNIPVALYGGSPEVLAQLQEVLRRRFPALDISYAEAPPFRPPTPEEDEQTTNAIRASGARVVLVGLGNTKQDIWMHAHRGRIPAVMLGVGAAFDFIAGAKPQAPRWMQRNGLEWAFRLATEPRRLWRRYLKQNPRFAVLALVQILRTRVTT
ncbi:MAG: WecB/TagA/CpsF family glycosyltransferase [Acidobacteriota bacterium]